MWYICCFVCTYLYLFQMRKVVVEVQGVIGLGHHHQQVFYSKYHHQLCNSFLIRSVAVPCASAFSGVWCVILCLFAFTLELL